MKYEEVKDLIDKLDQTSVAYLNYRFADGHLEISKEVPQVTSSPQGHPVSQGAPVINEGPAPAAPNPAPEVVAPDETTGEKKVLGEEVLAPMVGVAYLQPKPDSDPFVQIGDEVEQGDTVMIIEAMKLMNEIQAPVSGRVVDILVENETVVEYNQPLLIIQP